MLDFHSVSVIICRSIVALLLGWHVRDKISKRPKRLYFNYIRLHAFCSSLFCFKLSYHVILWHISVCYVVSVPDCRATKRLAKAERTALCTWDNVWLEAIGII